MEPNLVVIGISLRSAKLAIRERFLLDAEQRRLALSELVRSNGIDEVLVLSNCSRTEFLVWTQNAAEASSSVLRLLTQTKDLKLMEWSNFYRLVGDEAVAHVLRVACGADSAVFGEPEATTSLLSAWQQGQRESTTGRFLDALMARAFHVAGRIRQELAGGVSMATVAEAAVALCSEHMDDLRQRRVLVLGAGQMALAAVRELQKAEAGEISVVNRSWEHAQLLARQCSIKAVHAESLWEQVLHADVVISAISQKVWLTRGELELVLPERKQPILIVDLGVPRTVDRAAKALAGVTLLNLDDLCVAMDQSPARVEVLPRAERMIAEAAAGFRIRLLNEPIMPAISAVREQLEAICRQELTLLREQFGPFTDDQELALEALSSHISQRISAALARQMKELPGTPEMTCAIHQLFQMEAGSPVAAGSKRCD